jgi:hypothetical protein
MRQRTKSALVAAREWSMGTADDRPSSRWLLELRGAQKCTNPFDARYGTNTAESSRMHKLGWLLATLISVSGCADDAARPTTRREVCEQNASIACDYDGRRDVCAGRAVQPEAACADDFVADCCAVAGDCEAPFTEGKAATFDDFDACDAAVLEMSCDAVDGNTMPKQCDGVVK